MKYKMAMLLARALESGKYLQGQNVLQSSHHRYVKRCCLGVACVVAGLKPKYEPGFNLPYHLKVLDSRVASFEGEREFLPNSIMEKFGIKDKRGHCGYDKNGNQRSMKIKWGENNLSFDTLTSANDFGVPFPLIGKMIRKYWRWL